MKQLLKKSTLSLLLLLSSVPVAFGQSGINDACVSNLGPNSSVYTHINLRNQGSNSARRLMGWKTEIYRPDMCDYYGVGTFAFEYEQTFRGERIAQDWFGATSIAFQGSEVTNRSKNALIADYFGLGSEYDGVLNLCPKIQNFIFDWNFFVGLDNWMQGLYFQINMPLVHSKWSLRNGNNDNCLTNCCPSPVATGTLPACFAGSTEIPVVSSIEEALSERPSTASGLFSENQSGRFNFCEMTDTKLASLDLILGWLLYNDDCYHLGAFLLYGAPTGTNYSSNYKYQGDYFAPQIGNGHHNELGAGITAHAMLWDDQQCQSLAFYVEGNVTHLFANRQCRLFDLNNGAYSRYMFLRQFDANGNPTGEIFKANNTSIANRTIDVKIDAKVDFSFAFSYIYSNWALDLGYNVYYHSQETLDSKCDISCLDKDNFKYGVAALTGSCCYDAGVTTADGVCTLTSLDTSITNNVSSIVRDANMFELGSLDRGTVPTSPNDGNEVDVCLSYYSVVNGATTGTPCSELLVVDSGAQTSGFLNVDDINFRSGLSPAFLTHKLFGNLNYMWNDECGWNPFVGIGFEVEFDGGNRNNDCFDDSSCGVNTSNVCNIDSSCFDNNQRVGVNQWGIWIKGGINF